MAPGFGKAPFSKCLCTLCVGASVLASFLNVQHLCNLDIKNTFGHGQVWRLVTSHIVFSTQSGIFFGILLLYFFREFERRFKTPKFAVAVLVLTTLSTIFQLILLAAKVAKRLAPGPYSIVFGLFTFFFSDIPPSMKGGLLFIPISDKTFKYLFGLQLMFAEFPHSIWPSLCGLLAGVLYRSRLFPFQRIRMPLWVQRCCAQYCKCFYNQSRRRRNAGYQQVPEADPSMPQQLFGPPPAVPLVEPDPTRVQTLVGMGFEEQQARRALSRNGNNLEAAVGMLGASW